MLKLTTVLAFTFLLGFPALKAQSTPDIKWLSLKSTLETRIGCIDSLVDVLSASKYVNKDLISDTKRIAAYVYMVIHPITEVDPEFITYSSKINDKLTLSLAKTLATLENDRQFKGRKDAMTMLRQLESIENRLSIQRAEYNKLCKEQGRTNLIFGSDKSEAAPEVKF